MKGFKWRSDNCRLWGFGGFFVCFCYWGIVALQYCVSFCCTMKWINCIYTHIPSLMSLPPLPPSHPSRSSQSGLSPSYQTGLPPLYSTSHQLSSYMVFYLGFFLHIYRHTSERVWVQFQTTAIRQILQESESHEFFWFSSAYKNYVYTTQWPIKYAVGFCLEKQCTCCNLKALYW